MFEVSQMKKPLKSRAWPVATVTRAAWSSWSKISSTRGCFGFGELRLAPVRREEEFAFERQRPGNVKQVAGACETFRMDCGKVCGACDGGLDVQCHVEQRTTRDQMFESSQRGVAFARDVLTFSGGDRAALMKGALQNGVSHFQRVQRQKKQFGRTTPAILGNGLG